MTDVLVLHHALGRTPGVVAFADHLERAGHRVHVPDLYDGHTFDDLDDGNGYAREVGFGTIIERGVRAANDLPAALVPIGISLGVLPAQQLAQTRPGAIGAVLLESCVPPGEFGRPWPDEVPVQVHGMGADPTFAGEGDIDAARALVADVADGELFLYPGDRHLFTDASLPWHDADASAVLLDRVTSFLGRLG